MNNAALLSNIIFQPRLSKHCTNGKEALQYQRETKLGLCWLHTGCCSVCTSLADVILILQWFKSELQDSRVSTNFPVSSFQSFCDC